MKAVILPTGKPGLLKPLTEWMPEFLLPVVNKPIVEHLIELLVRNDIKDIILVLKHMPYETEQYFGNGERWGANISYSLEREYEGISSSLGRVRSRLEESILCLPGNIVTDMDISGFINTHKQGPGELTISRLKDEERNNEAIEPEAFGPFIMGQKALSRVLSRSMNQNLKQIISFLATQGLASNTYYGSHKLKRIRTPHDYLEVNKLILEGVFSGIIIPGKQIKSGIWVGRRVKIHSDARVSPPSLIGSYCSIRNDTSIGNHTIIGDKVIVDRGVSMENSVILGSTYIGSHTEIKDSIIRKNCMVNVPRLLNVCVGDEFILGDLDKQVITKKSERLFNLTIALFFLLLFSPIIIILCLYSLIFSSKKIFISDERFGGYEIGDLQGKMEPKPFTFYAFNTRSRLIGKLPGLFNVIKGDMNLVGNSPITRGQLNSLQEEWETMRFKAAAGLFHLWELEGDKDITWEEKVVTENYYANTRSFLGDVKILLRIFCRIWRI